MSIKNVNAIAELEEAGVTFKWAGENQIKCKCPFHSDNTPSCFINVETNQFYCQASSCNASGDIVSFIAKLGQTTRKLVMLDLGKKYNIEIAKIINADVIERYHARIDAAGFLKKALLDRGVNEKLIRKYRLGEFEGRITIPIKNEAGMFVNIRKYLPGAPGDRKFKNTRGYSKPRLFPIDQLQYETIVICGGECKAMVAADELNQHGIGAITVTAGEGSWEPHFTREFSNKRVYVCMDIDAAGKKAAETYAALLHRVTDFVGIVYLPLNEDKYPTGDINDYVAREGGKLFPLLEDVKEWTPRITTIDSNETPAKMELSKAVHADNISKRVEVQANITAMDSTPYAVPKKVLPVCDKKQDYCSICPLYNAPDGETHEINPESEAVLELLAATKQGLRTAIMSGLNVPPGCRSFQADVLESYNAEDVRISPKLEISSESNERKDIPAICIGDGIELNENYKLIGRLWPSPKDQKQTFVIANYETSEDALSTYDPGDTSDLKLFQPTEWTVEGIQNKLDSLYEDLEANVTRVFLRRDIHFVADLSYHSALWINFDGKPVKGWVETLIMGDSSQGKSEAVISLQGFYRLGEKTDCKNATVAGLLGGLQQMGTKWFVSWGVLPRFDRRLVILEELKGASTEVISHLTDMRSSGIAELPKIEKKRTNARTRIIALSNPRNDLSLDGYNFGVEAVQELIGAMEDVRRFDCILTVSRSDVDASELNNLMLHRPDVEHIHTDKLCRRLILWAWTRKKIVFENTQSILDSATELCEGFTDRVPIVDKGSQRYKVARLATALAIRTFSTEDGETVLVKDCHVQYIVQFLKRIYAAASLGYKDYTRALKLANNLSDPEAVKKRVHHTNYPKDFVQQLLSEVYVDLQMVQDLCGVDRSNAQALVSFLVRKRALLRHKRVYKKSPDFTDLLKQMLEEDNFRQGIEPDDILNDVFKTQGEF